MSKILDQKVTLKKCQNLREAVQFSFKNNFLILKNFDRPEFYNF